MVVQLQKIT